MQKSQPMRYGDVMLINKGYQRAEVGYQSLAASKKKKHNKTNKKGLTAKEVLWITQLYSSAVTGF